MIEQYQRFIPPQQSLTAFIPSYFTEISREVEITEKFRKLVYQNKNASKFIFLVFFLIYTNSFAVYSALSGGSPMCS
jgi:hypothetical protein